MIAAAVGQELAIGVVEREVTRELRRSGLTGVASVASSLVVGEKLNAHGPRATHGIAPKSRHSGRREYPERGVPRSSDGSQAPVRSTDNVVAAYLTFLAEEQVSARTARLYLGHLGRFAVWLREHYATELVDATSHDLREYRAGSPTIRSQRR